MNAIAPANAPTIGEVQGRESQIRKVQRLSKAAMAFFTCLTILAVCYAIYLFIMIIAQPLGSNPRILMSAWDAVGPQTESLRIKFVAFAVMAPYLCLVFGMLRHLNLLFRNLSEGLIYTDDNVRHILQVGRLWVGVGAWNLGLPLLTMIPLWIGFIDANAVTVVGYRYSPGSISAIVSAFLVILIAWIMDVGRQTQDEAVQLREEANLVV